MFDLESLLGKIHQTDCLPFMRAMPDKCIDLIVCDPPYGIGIDGQKESFAKNPKHNRKAHEFLGWDNEIPSKEYFDEMYRVSKNQIIWGGNYFVEHLNEGHKGWIVWDKGQHGLTMSDCELAYSSFDVPTRILVANRVEIMKDGAWHPTQKPIKIIEQCIERYGKQSDIIFDPFAGSGTTLVAAKQLGRQFLGCELSEKYVAIANERLKQDYLF